MARKHAGMKALRQSQRHQVHNDARRRTVDILLRQYRAAVKSGSDVARLLPTLVKAIDKAAQRHVLPKNTAARIKSRAARLKPAAKSST